MQFQPFAKDVEVCGLAIDAIVGGFALFPDLGLEKLAAHGIGEVRPSDRPQASHAVLIDRHRWYSQQSWLDAFADIAQSLGGGLMFKIGCQVPNFAAFPEHGSDHADNILDGLKALDVAYHMNHRKSGVVMYNAQSGAMLEGIGHYKVLTAHARTIVMCCENPYPCDFDRGLLHAIATHFEPSAETVHDRLKPCRKSGGHSCTFQITW